MDHFEDGEEQAEERYDVHHQQEDGLLCGARHEAVHGVGTWRAGADVGWQHFETIEDVLAKKERNLKGRAPKQLAHIDLH